MVTTKMIKLVVKFIIRAAITTVMIMTTLSHPKF